MNRLLGMSIVALFSATYALQAFAQDEGTCSGQLLACFDLTEEARDLCFRNSAKLTSCRDTEEGRLATKRAAFSSSFSQSSDDGDAPSEATIIDRDCVENFDNFWLGSLVNGSSSRDAIFNLSQMLQGCARSSADDMMRP